MRDERDTTRWKNAASRRNGVRSHARSTGSLWRCDRDFCQ